MNKNFLEKLPPEEKTRLAYIEGRPDLFETKVLQIKRINKSETGNEKKLLVSTRDPGSADALLPVIEKLMDDAQIITITDGRAQETIQKKFQTKDITPKNMALEIDGIIGTPKIILMDISGSEMGIDTYTTATFPKVPKILVESYYTESIPYLTELIKRNLPFPEKICVMDKSAKELIVKRFPQLEKITKITGQPSFDRFAKENTEQISRKVKKELKLQPTDKLVSYMSTKDEPEKIKIMAEALKKIADKFYFVFRSHPRDNIRYEVYKKILVDAGLMVIDTDKLSTDDIGAASDVVLTTWSTTGLHGIYRRKPTAHIIDKNFRVEESLELPIAPVKFGASVGVDKVSEIARVLPQLLDSNSKLNRELRKNMDKYYPADGKNAERVANIVRGYLK